MKILRNSKVFNLLLLLMTIIVGIASYYAYWAYSEYKAVKNITSPYVLVKDISKLLNSLEIERTNSAVYLAKEDQKSLNNVIQTRKQVDESLKKLEDAVNSNDTYTVYNKQVGVVSTVLEDVRKEVESGSNDYREILFGLYHEKIYGALDEILMDLATSQSIDELTHSLTIYNEISRFKENITLENTLITYFIVSSNPMDQETALIWEKVTKNEIFPKFEVLRKDKLALQLKGLISQESFNPILNKEREMIRYEASSGGYSVSLGRWLEKIAQKMDYISQAEILLQKDIEHSDALGSEHNKSMMLMALGILYGL